MIVSEKIVEKAPTNINEIRQKVFETVSESKKRLTYGELEKSLSKKFAVPKKLLKTAINELVVGIGFMAGPFIADRVMALTNSFRWSYLTAAVIVGAGVLGQTILATVLRRKYRRAREKG